MDSHRFISVWFHTGPPTGPEISSSCPRNFRLYLHFHSTGSDGRAVSRLPDCIPDFGPFFSPFLFLSLCPLPSGFAFFRLYCSAQLLFPGSLPTHFFALLTPFTPISSSAAASATLSSDCLFLFCLFCPPLLPLSPPPHGLPFNRKPRCADGGRLYPSFSILWLLFSPLPLFFLPLLVGSFPSFPSSFTLPRHLYSSPRRREICSEGTVTVGDNPLAGLIT